MSGDAGRNFLATTTDDKAEKGCNGVDEEIKFSQLPAGTQKFLRELRDEDIGLLSEAIRLVRSLLTVGRVVKWTIVTIVGAFVGMAMLGDAIMKLKGWMFR